MSERKGEFALKEMFEKLEKGKDAKHRSGTAHLRRWKTFAFSLLGAMCGGLIFYAINWWLSIFSVLFFLINGIGAYTFTDVFLKDEPGRRKPILIILLSDILSVLLTLTLIYLTVPAYSEDRISKGHSMITALTYYFFQGRFNVQIWAVGILLAFLGTFLGFLICRTARGLRS